MYPIGCLHLSNNVNVNSVCHLRVGKDADNQNIQILVRGFTSALGTNA